MKPYVFLFILVVLLVSGCTYRDDMEAFDNSRDINLISREDGSGTRAAFVEILNILEKDSMGNVSDNSYEEAVVLNTTDAIMTILAGDRYALGYISLGSLNKMVKPLSLDGVEASPENIKDGSYKISRPFNIVYKDKENLLLRDFINFISSTRGKKIIEAKGFVANSHDDQVYKSLKSKGKITIGGSTSISPLMEDLVDEYKKLNPSISIEIQSTGSSAGLQAVHEKAANLAMVSRELKENEKSNLSYQTIALDGIIMIVNKKNPMDNIKMEQIRLAFTGKLLKWKDIEVN